MVFPKKFYKLGEFTETYNRVYVVSFNIQHRVYLQHRVYVVSFSKYFGILLPLVNVIDIDTLLCYITKKT